MTCMIYNREINEQLLFDNLYERTIFTGSVNQRQALKRSVELTHQFLLKYGDKIPTYRVVDYKKLVQGNFLMEQSLKVYNLDVSNEIIIDELFSRISLMDNPRLVILIDYFIKAPMHVDSVYECQVDTLLLSKDVLK